MAKAKNKSRAVQGRRMATPAKSGAKKPAKDSGKNGSGWWQNSAQFLREVKTELKKVTWPTRKQTVSSTLVVVVLVIIVAVFLGLVDAILAKLIGLVIG